jgi:endoglucanase
LELKPPAAVAVRQGMKTFALCFACFLALTALAQPEAGDAFARNRQLGRGVNILGYDPIWRSRGEARFQEKNFRLLKEAGFNSVRVNLHAFRHMDATRDFALRESWFATLDWVVDRATAQGLSVILDLHEFNAMGENPAANKEKFLAFWRQVAPHYRKASDRVVFEILNEPCKQLSPTLWNEYLREALAIIRQTNPTRAVIIGPAFWNGIDHLKELELPAEDRHLIVTVHYYQPMEFTHQGAGWSGHKDKSGVAWPGTEAERQKLAGDFGKVATWAKAQNRPIFLGEFGAYDKAPMESRTRYTDAVARTAESLGWGWAYWQFDSDFILYDVKQDAWVEPILKALIPAKH